MALVTARFGRWPSFWRASAIFFVLHTAGYFAGGQAMAFLTGLSRQKPAPLLDAASWVVLGKLSWGLFYGLGFGAGLGFVFAILQDRTRTAPPGSNERKAGR